MLLAVINYGLGGNMYDDTEVLEDIEKLKDLNDFKKKLNKKKLNKWELDTLFDDSL